jgi:hypothetical protein
VSSTVVLNGVTVAEVPTVNGAGRAVWEVVAANNAATETYDFPVYLATEGSVGSGTGTVKGDMGPVSTTSTAVVGAPVPRFGAAGTAVSFVAPPRLTVSCSTPDGPARVGVSYTVECTAKGGSEPYSWGIQGGALPAGLAQSGTTGTSIQVQGAPTTPGAYSYKIEVGDSSLPAQRASVAFSGTIAERITTEIPGSASAIAVSPAGKVFVIGTTPCNAGGCPPYRWNGSSFERIDRDGSGTRIAVDATERLWLVNQLSAIYRYTTPAAEISEQVPGGAMDIAAGGERVYILGTGVCDAAGCLPYMWTETGFRGMQGRGNRIAADWRGMLWMVDNAGAIYRFRSAAIDAVYDRIPGEATAVAASADGFIYIVGTEGCDGNGCTVKRYNGFGFTPLPGVTAVEIGADRNGVLWLVTKTGQILRYPQGEPMRMSCAPAAGPATAGVPYSTACTVSNGQAPFQWSIGGGTLPAGLALNQAGATATIAGTPAGTGPYQFTVTVQDSFSPRRSLEQTLTGTIGPPPVPLTVSCVPATGPTNAGVGYSTTCTASGGAAPYKW